MRKRKRSKGSSGFLEWVLVERREQRELLRWECVHRLCAEKQSHERCLLSKAPSPLLIPQSEASMKRLKLKGKRKTPCFTFPV
jgi:hypothetical protein